ASLQQNPRPVVVANPDVIAPLETAFSTESGFVAHRLADLLGSDIEFHGKPFPSVFDLVERCLPADQPGDRICMIGDTLHTDVLGGAQAGWQTVLVSDHGLFRGFDTASFIEESGIVPDWIVPSI
ncbi:MAG: HAD hydrolase-like protein, partial [Pseudomonadota bacterium]